MGVDLHCHVRQWKYYSETRPYFFVARKATGNRYTMRYTSRKKNLTDMRRPLHAYLLYGSSNNRIREMGVLLRATSLWPIYSRATPTCNISVVKTY